MIYQKDVQDFLEGIQDETADLIIADPPYGIDKDYGMEDSWTTIESWAKWCDDWLKECDRVLKPGGSIMVYGIHNYLCYNQISLYKLGLKYRRQFIWHYENGFCGNRKLPRATYEPLLWFTKGDGYYFTEMREPYKSAERLKYEVRKGGKVWKPHPDGRIAGDVWNIPTLAGRRFKNEKVDHPSQKPMALSERLITHFSPPGGDVVVPFCGSGSECLAAYRLGRKFQSTEINPRYKEIAEGRLRSEGWRGTGEQDHGNPKRSGGDKSTVDPCASIVNH
jgi:DNA modification methylase